MKYLQYLYLFILGLSAIQLIHWVIDPKYYYTPRKLVLFTLILAILASFLTGILK